MRKSFLKASLKYAFIGLLGLYMPSLAAMACGNPTVLWHNTIDPGCPSIKDGITADVIDTDIDIQGFNGLVGGIHVVAQTCDPVITVTNGDSILTGSVRCDGVATPEPRLYLYAAEGRTITFRITDDFFFRGDSEQRDLLVSFSGGGELIFELGDEAVVAFCSDVQPMGGLLQPTGGTQFYVIMGDPSLLPPQDPTVTFVRANKNSTQDVNIIVCDKSCISYAGPSDDAEGAINFNPSNEVADGDRLGMMTLEVRACSCVDISGHLLSDPNADFLISDIQLLQVAGNPFFRVLNDKTTANTYGGLQVVNSNNCCTHLAIDPFCDGSFTGTKKGFILGPQGTLVVDDQAYLDYIGATTNICCPFDQSRDPNCGDKPSAGERLRNGSAFIVDAQDDTSPVTIQLDGNSAIYFRSVVNKCGEEPTLEGVINPDDVRFDKVKTPCVGNIVFDVEGPLNIVGELNQLSGEPLSGIQILSLEVTKTGCPVLVPDLEGTAGPAVFPQRTFARNDVESKQNPDGEYLRYNSAGFLINNQVQLFNTALVHTDENHEVYEQGNQGNPALNSEPAYLGGDSHKLCKFTREHSRCRPCINLINSQARWHSSAAATGVDFCVPAVELFEGQVANDSRFIFYNNGRCIDDGSGRNLILGTDPCYIDCCFATEDKDSHLNVMQTSAFGPIGVANPTLFVDTRMNDSCVTEGILADDEGCAIQTIYLNNASNISIGTLGDTGEDCFGNDFDVTATAELCVEAPCISFETRGGTLGYPQSSGTTGEGGIFVDTNGTFKVAAPNGNPYITNIGAMVTKSANGHVDLPNRSVFFDSRVGIQDWNLDLNEDRVIVEKGQDLSNYSLDWENVRQELCCTNDASLTCFRPYELKQTPNPCECPAVTFQNLTDLPCVKGTVDQLQVLRSRICDPVHLKVDGGLVRELVFLTGYNSAEAPVGVVVVQNGGTVGLGSADTNVDSLDANVVLGVNGVQVIANGDGVINMNDDLVINNVCHFLTGTAFGVNQPESLKLYSATPRELRIKSTGTLDLSQFDNPNKILEIGGQVTVVAEPGSRIIFGAEDDQNGGTLLFTDEARLIGDLVNNLENFSFENGPASTDPFRVKISGVGEMRFTEDSQWFVHQQTFWGIETYPACSNLTTITVRILDQASVEVGSEDVPGGALQIGDTLNPQPISPERVVNFYLRLGNEFAVSRGALFQVDRQGLLGFGVGAVDKTSNIPNAWTVGCLQNVGVVDINIIEGIFTHNQIETGNNARASLLAVGNEGSYTLNFNQAITGIRGGGNLIRIACNELCDEDECSIVPQSVTPTVTEYAGLYFENGYELEAGIHASERNYEDTAIPAKAVQPVNVTAKDFFDYLKLDDYDEQISWKVAPYSVEHQNIGSMVYRRLISVIDRQRLSNYSLYSNGGVMVGEGSSHDYGAIGFDADQPTGVVGLTIALQGANTSR